MRKEEQMLDMLDPILDGNYLLYNENLEMRQSLPR